MDIRASKIVLESRSNTSGSSSVGKGNSLEENFLFPICDAADSAFNSPCGSVHIIKTKAPINSGLFCFVLRVGQGRGEKQREKNKVGFIELS